MTVIFLSPTPWGTVSGSTFIGSHRAPHLEGSCLWLNAAFILFKQVSCIFILHWALQSMTPALIPDKGP